MQTQTHSSLGKIQFWECKQALHEVVQGNYQNVNISALPFPDLHTLEKPVYLPCQPFHGPYQNKIFC